MEEVQNVQAVQPAASVQNVRTSENDLNVLNGAQQLNDLNQSSDSLTVVGWLWKDTECKTQYTPEHANTWARMIHRNLRLPHRFVLLTDQPDEDYDPLITPMPLWNDWRAIKNERWGTSRPHCYVRLKSFSDEISKLLGPRFVSIDLDCVVLQNLDSLFDRPEDFLIYRRHVQAIPFDRINCYQGSMWMMDAGARSKVWEEFRGAESVRAAAAYMGTDQAWLRHILGPDENGWTQQDGVYGWPCIRQEHKNHPPRGASIVFFYGGIKPWSFLQKKTTYDCPWVAENYN